MSHDEGMDGRRDLHYDLTTLWLIQRKDGV